MGYELSKLMRHYGVTTPSAPVYTGTTDQDRANYNAMVADYGNRVASVPMYSQPQYKTALSPAATPAYQGTFISPQDQAAMVQKYATGNAGNSTVAGAMKDAFLSSAEMGDIKNLYNQSTPEGQAVMMSTLKDFDPTGYWTQQFNAAPAAQPKVATTTTTPTTTPTPANMEWASNVNWKNVNYPYYTYAEGGAVKTNFAVGGINDLANQYEVATPVSYGVAPLSDSDGGSILQRGVETGTISQSDAARVRASMGPGGQAKFENWMRENNIVIGDGAGSSAPVAAQAAPSDRFQQLQTMLGQYGPEQDVYAPELKAARERANQETQAFSDMLTQALESPDDSKASKAEMYFRLAAAFGAPTRTGQFSENLAAVGKEMGDYAKGKRESAREKLALKLKGQELRMGAAKEELGTLRALSSEEMKDRRAMTQSLIKDYIESGKPQSTAGKTALDEGLVPGTLEYQARVKQLADMDIQRQIAQINASVASVVQGTRREEREVRKEEREERKESRLTGQEITMKRDTEDAIDSIGSALSQISRAYKLNPNTFDTSTVDTARRKALEFAGSKDPKLLNTRELENLLRSEMITSAAQKMKGVLSDSDITLLQSIQGLDSKSTEERGRILRNAYQILQRAEKRMRTRLQDISSGAYRQTTGE